MEDGELHHVPSNDAYQRCTDDSSWRNSRPDGALHRGGSAAFHRERGRGGGYTGRHEGSRGSGSRGEIGDVYGSYGGGRSDSWQQGDESSSYARGDAAYGRSLGGNSYLTSPQHHQPHHQQQYPPQQMQQYNAQHQHHYHQQQQQQQQQRQQPYGTQGRDMQYSRSGQGSSRGSRQNEHDALRSGQTISTVASVAAQGGPLHCHPLPAAPHASPVGGTSATGSLPIPAAAAGLCSSTLATLIRANNSSAGQEGYGIADSTTFALSAQQPSGTPSTSSALACTPTAPKAWGSGNTAQKLAPPQGVLGSSNRKPHDPQQAKAPSAPKPMSLSILSKAALSAGPSMQPIGRPAQKPLNGLVVPAPAPAPDAAPMTDATSAATPAVPSAVPDTPGPAAVAPADPAQTPGLPAPTALLQAPAEPVFGTFEDGLLVSISTAPVEVHNARQTAAALASIARPYGAAGPVASRGKSEDSSTSEAVQGEAPARPSLTSSTLPVQPLFQADGTAAASSGRAETPLPQDPRPHSAAGPTVAAAAPPPIPAASSALPPSLAGPKPSAWAVQPVTFADRVRAANMPALSPGQRAGLGMPAVLQPAARAADVPASSTPLLLSPSSDPMVHHTQQQQWHGQQHHGQLRRAAPQAQQLRHSSSNNSSNGGDRSGRTSRRASASSVVPAPVLHPPLPGPADTLEAQELNQDVGDAAAAKDALAPTSSAPAPAVVSCQQPLALLSPTVLNVLDASEPSSAPQTAAKAGALAALMPSSSQVAPADMADALAGNGQGSGGAPAATISEAAHQTTALGKSALQELPASGLASALSSPGSLKAELPAPVACVQPCTPDLTAAAAPVLLDAAEPMASQMESAACDTTSVSAAGSAPATMPAKPMSWAERAKASAGTSALPSTSGTPLRAAAAGLADAETQTRTGAAASTSGFVPAAAPGSATRSGRGARGAARAADGGPSTGRGHASVDEGQGHAAGGSVPPASAFIGFPGAGLSEPTPMSNPTALAGAEPAALPADCPQGAVKVGLTGTGGLDPASMAPPLAASNKAMVSLVADAVEQVLGRVAAPAAASDVPVAHVPQASAGGVGEHAQPQLSTPAAAAAEDPAAVPLEPRGAPTAPAQPMQPAVGTSTTSQLGMPAQSSSPLPPAKREEAAWEEVASRKVRVRPAAGRGATGVAGRAAGGPKDDSKRQPPNSGAKAAKPAGSSSSESGAVRPPRGGTASMPGAPRVPPASVKPPPPAASTLTQGTASAAGGQAAIALAAAPPMPAPAASVSISIATAKTMPAAAVDAPEEAVAEPAAAPLLQPSQTTDLAESVTAVDGVPAGAAACVPAAGGGGDSVAVPAAAATAVPAALVVPAAAQVDLAQLLEQRRQAAVPGPDTASSTEAEDGGAFSSGGRWGALAAMDGGSLADAGGVAVAGADPAVPSTEDASAPTAPVQQHAAALAALRELVAEAAAEGRWAGGAAALRLAPRGLVNTGNSCFLNSVLQALMGTSQFCGLLARLCTVAPAMDPIKSPTLCALSTFAAEFQLVKALQAQGLRTDVAQAVVATAAATASSVRAGCAASLAPPLAPGAAGTGWSHVAVKKGKNAKAAAAGTAGGSSTTAGVPGQAGGPQMGIAAHLAVPLPAAASLGGRALVPSMLNDVIRRFSPAAACAAAGGGSAGRPAKAQALVTKRGQSGQGSSQEQEDAGEFLNFLMEAAHEELLQLRRSFSSGGSTTTDAAAAMEAAAFASGGDAGEWAQVGRRSKAAITRSQEQEHQRTLLSTIFRSSVKSTVKASGHKPSVTTEPTWMLHLAIQHESVRSIDTALAHYAGQETIPDFKPNNSDTGVEAFKSVCVHRLPEVLVLHLNRFSYGTTGMSKVHKVVAFNTTLHLRKPVLSDDSPDARGGGADYRLVATVSHHGRSMTGGHYTADVLQADGHWLRFNDAAVEVATVPDVLEQKPYLLFYQRVNT